LEGLAAVNPVVAARCLVEGGAQAGKVVRRDVVLALVRSLEDERVALNSRVLAGQLLARLGDPRPGVGVNPETGLPDIAWCEVLAGSFIMGTREEEIPALLEQFGGDRRFYEWEVPQHKVTLPAYRISKYPVTNAQYAAFVAAGGYQERRHWTGAGWRWKGDRSGPGSYGGVYDLPNHPVVMVTWYEAAAFCSWLTEELRKEGEVAPDEKVTLPSEAEWEKSARGTDGRVYPWGDEANPNRANYSDTGIGTTSAVGCFPGGASPYGVEDLSGNVWEWCRTKWQASYEDYRDEDDLEGGDARVLRGGAFDVESWFVRCAYRYWNLPNDGSYNVGFRIVVAPNLTSAL
jgi:formylglycine-generating enzyme required for sulfatase activity